MLVHPRFFSFSTLREGSGGPQPCDEEPQAPCGSHPPRTLVGEHRCSNSRGNNPGTCRVFSPATCPEHGAVLTKMMAVLGLCQALVPVTTRQGTKPAGPSICTQELCYVLSGVLGRYWFRDFLASLINLQSSKNTFICSFSSASTSQKQYYTFMSHCPPNLLPNGCLVSSKSISSA